MFHHLASFVSMLSCLFCALEGPRAKCENGPLVGKYEISQSGFKYKAFRGIPYAEPPVGEYRFQGPVNSSNVLVVIPGTKTAIIPLNKNATEPHTLKNTWTGEWNAQSFGSSCLQLDHFKRSYFDNGSFTFHQVGDEDCLYLNVYTREGGPSQKDIIFAIHGGAFMFGSSEMYNPKIVMDRDDVVLVSINYRVGPLGFLTTGDNVVPGNNGLKDQVAALEWVNRNIANFGGDPKKITIIGLSAGGASVDYMYLTPLTKGLFLRGYSYSGTSLCSWALVEDGVLKTKKLAENLGCPTTDSKTILKCLRRRPAQEIVEEVRSLMVFLYNPFTIFGPVIEVNSSRPYIDQHPRDIMKQKLYHKLPWLNGFTTEDGLYPAADFITRENLLTNVDQEWEKVGPSLLFLSPKHSTEEKKNILNDIRREYFGDEPISKEKNNLVRLLSNRLFGAGIFEAVTLRDGSYLYLYGHQGERSTAYGMTNSIEDLGAAHGDDIFLLFGFDSLKYNSRDKQMMKILENILYTFLKEGKVPEDLKWKPWSQSKSLLIIKAPDNISTTDKFLFNLKHHKNLFKEFDS